MAAVDVPIDTLTDTFADVSLCDQKDQGSLVPVECQASQCMPSVDHEHNAVASTSVLDPEVGDIVGEVNSDDNGRSRKKKDKRNEKDEKYCGPPIPPAEISELAKSNEERILKTISSYLESVNLSENDLCAKHTFDVAKKIKVSMPIERCFKVALVVSSLYQTAEDVAPLNAMISFIFAPQLEVIMQTVTELCNLLHECLLYPQRYPVPRSALSVLHEMHLMENQGESRRYSHYSIYCRACDQHVRSMLGVVEHVRNREHVYYASRLALRAHVSRVAQQQLQHRNVRQLLWVVKDEVDAVLTQLSDLEYMWLGIDARDLFNHVHKLLEHSLTDVCDSIDLSYIGGFPSGLLTLNGELTADFFLNLGPENVGARTRLKHALPHAKSLYDTAFPGIHSQMVFRGRPINVFVTTDPRARNAATFSTLRELFAKYSVVFYHTARLFRSWASRFKFCNTYDDRGICGAVFDIMTIFFLQRRRLFPRLCASQLQQTLAEMVACPREVIEQKLGPLFEQHKPPNPFPMQSLAPIFMDLITFYAGEFDLSEVIQIDAEEPVFKDKPDQRNFRVVEPVSQVNLCQSRLEVDAFFQAILFHTAVQMGQFQDQWGRMILHLNKRRAEIPFILFTTYRTRPAHLIPLDPYRAWHPHKNIRCPRLVCDFCNGEHVERACPSLTKEPVQRLIPSDVTKQLTNVIEREFEEKSVQPDELQRAQDFVGRLEQELRQALNEPAIRLSLFGSLVSGFGHKNSDLDLCLRLDQDDYSDEDEEKGADLLRRIHQHMVKTGFGARLVTGAKVPIVKFEKHLDEIDGDISFYNCLALHNTAMLREYCAFDERVPKLGMAVKSWARAFDLNDASVGTVSSYALIVLLIHYLQRVEPPVLPRLQDPSVCPDLESQKPVEVGEWQVLFYKPTAQFREAFTKNEQSVGELFAGFFDFYADKFVVDEEVAQIRVARRMTKIEKEWTRSVWAVEDPFDLNHNLTSGVKKMTGLYIAMCMNNMQHILRDRVAVITEPSFSFDQFSQFVADTNGAVGFACFHCKQRGHTMNWCPELQEQRKERRKIAKKREADAKRKRKETLTSNNNDVKVDLGAKEKLIKKETNDIVKEEKNTKPDANVAEQVKEKKAKLQRSANVVLNQRSQKTKAEVKVKEVLVRSQQLSTKPTDSSAKAPSRKPFKLKNANVAKVVQAPAKISTNLQNSLQTGPDSARKQEKESKKKGSKKQKQPPINPAVVQLLRSHAERPNSKVAPPEYGHPPPIVGGIPDLRFAHVRVGHAEHHLSDLCADPPGQPVQRSKKQRKRQK